MVYVNTIVILIVYAIEPYLWIKSMSVLPRRFENGMYYILAGLGYYIFTVVKQFATFLEIEGSVINYISSGMTLYVLIITICLFEEEIYKKVLSLGVFCIIVTASEVSVMSAAIYVGGIPLGKIMLFNKVNVICTSIAKLMIIPLIRFIFLGHKKKLIDTIYDRREIITIAIASSLFVLPMASILRNSSLSRSREVIFLFGVTQILMVINSVYIIWVLRNKDSKLIKAKEEINELKSIMSLTTRLKQLEHDMNTHATIISNLVHNKCYKELGDYVDNTFQDIQAARNICTISDRAVASIINNLIEKASERSIQFSRHIMLDEFFIPSKDVCGIVSNMVNNAIEATENLVKEKRYISLDIFPSEGGYNITCMNPYEKKIEYFKTTKSNKDKHGFGLGIIKSIVEKNGGAMEIIPNDLNWFEITCFIPIPVIEEKEGRAIQ